MAEETREEQIQQAELEKINKVKETLDLLNNKGSKFLFFVTQTHNPSASMYEVYFHANVVKDMGYDVKILTDASDYEIPYWLDEGLTDLPHESVQSARLSVGPQDVLVIPEIFSNVMEQTKNLPSIRVALFQSVDYMMNALIPATDWSSFGIEKVITTSGNMRDFLEEFMGKNKFDIKVYDVGIPSYFKNDDIPKRPVISIVGRNPNEISKLIKLFYAKYPQFSWITFDSMITDSKPPRALRRKEFAERLRKNFASVWVDRIASFGTFPLEAMASGSIPIALVPDMPLEYLMETDENGEESYRENSGVWTNDFYALPILIGDTLTKYLDDTIEEEVYDTMAEISSHYNQDWSKEQIIKIYQGLIEERTNTLQKTVDDFENSQKEEVVEEK